MYNRLLLIRLEELSRNKDVEVYLFSREMGMSDDNLFRDEKTVEYEALENELKSSLIEEINMRSSYIFENVNSRDFNLNGIRQQLEALVHPHWQSRNEFEQKRDSLLHLQYNFYSNQYTQVVKYLELKEIDKSRKEFKEKVKQQLISEFKNIFIDELTANKLQEFLRNQVSYYSTNLKERAKEYFETRTETIIERDTFGYVDIENYERCLGISLQQAIEVFQSKTREENIELYLEFLRKKINSGNGLEYPGKIDDDLHNYITNLVEKRDQDEIRADNFRLIELDTYLKWSYFALDKIETEYPKLFIEVEDDDEEYHDNGNSYNNLDSKTEKYGGYNGYDDDTIDDAFEGDPSNTWNVD